MRISTTSASELLMLLNVLSGAFGSSDVSTEKIKLADYKNNFGMVKHMQLQSWLFAKPHTTLFNFTNKVLTY